MLSTTLSSLIWLRAALSQALSLFLQTTNMNDTQYHRLSDNDTYNDDDDENSILAVGVGDVELQNIKWSTKNNGRDEPSPSSDSFADNPRRSYDDDDENDDDVDDGYNPLIISQNNGHHTALSADGHAHNNDDNIPTTTKHHHRRKLRTPQVYPQRWVQLGYLSTLALISDWVCFSTASIPDIFELAYPNHTNLGEGIIDKFLVMNVLSCLFVTDIVSKYGLQSCTKYSSLVMTVGCWLRSGLGIVTVILFDVCKLNREEYEYITKYELIDGYGPMFGLPSFPILVIGTLMVGMAQPFFQCTPPLLSAQWFASNERATSSAIALNFNQVGIAAAFVVGGIMANDDEGLNRYFALIAVISTVITIGTFRHFEDLPPIPPSASELEKMENNHGQSEPPFSVSVRKFFKTPGFVKPLIAFIFSIAITNVVGAFIDEVMERGGVTDRKAVAWAGCGFEFAIVLGGIILGRYVDRTKKYKSVTLACTALSLVFILPLGLTQHQLGKEPVLLVISLFLLGFFVGPVQPINVSMCLILSYMCSYVYILSRLYSTPQLTTG